MKDQDGRAASRGNASDAGAGLFRRPAASASYANFYIAQNRARATFNDSNGSVALNTLAGFRIAGAILRAGLGTPA